MLKNAAFIALVALLAGTASGAAAPAFSCGGFAQLGGAQLLCSHVDPKSPPLICTYSWTLQTLANGVQVVNGSFLLVRGMTNLAVYQGSGVSAELSTPIVLCQAKRSGL